MCWQSSIYLSWTQYGEALLLSASLSRVCEVLLVTLLVYINPSAKPLQMRPALADYGFDHYWFNQKWIVLSSGIYQNNSMYIQYSIYYTGTIPTIRTNDWPFSDPKSMTITCPLNDTFSDHFIDIPAVVIVLSQLRNWLLPAGKHNPHWWGYDNFRGWNFTLKSI